MHVPGYAMFLLILAGALIATHLGYQLFRWALKSATSTPEEHPLDPLLDEFDNTNTDNSSGNSTPETNN